MSEQNINDLLDEEINKESNSTEEEFIFPEEVLKESKINKENSKVKTKKRKYLLVLQQLVLKIKLPHRKSAKENTEKSMKETEQDIQEQIYDSSKPLSLMDAYNILDIRYYPASYEDVRMAYYMQELNAEEHRIELLQRARKLIYDNISENPFEVGSGIFEKKENDSSKDDIYLQPSETQISETVLSTEETSSTKTWFEVIKFRISTMSKRKKSKQKSLRWGDVEKEINNRTATKISTGKKTTKKRKKRKKRGVLKFIFYAAAVLFIIYLIYEKQENNYNPSELSVITEKNQLLEDETSKNNNTSENYISVERSLQLLENDGLKIEGEVVEFKREELTNYSSEQLLHIPFVNLYLLRREFTANKPYMTYRVYDYSFYKFKGSNDPEKAWTHKNNFTSYEVIDYNLEGTWTGTCTTGNGKYELSNVVLTMEATSNGYLTAEFEFLSDQKAPGKVLMEGKYNPKKNQFVLYTREWIERPTLFVAPELLGKIDLNTYCITQTPKTTKTMFSLATTTSSVSQFEISNHLIKGLLQGKTATYENSIIPLKDMTSCKVISISNKTEEQCEVTIDGYVDRKITDYQVKGTATLKKHNGIWIVKETKLNATLKKTDLSGTLKGTEKIGKQTYYVTYEILKEENKKNTYIATVSKKHRLLPFIIITKEKRRMFLDQGSIKNERIDLIKGNIKGEAVENMLINYSKDNIEGDILRLTKQ